MTTATSTRSITVTDRAFRRIAEIMRDEPGALGLRVSVSGGGCSGFQYGFDVEKKRNPDDLVLAKDGVAVLVDDLSVQYMAGSEIDFVDDLIGAKFEVKNPNATSSCGCGTSFSL
jgi:iron-sulfur cluster assembly accessory protein